MISYEKEDKHFRSICHKLFDQFTITRYLVENPNIKNLSEIMKKYVEIHNEKYSFFIIFV